MISEILISHKNIFIWRGEVEKTRKQNTVINKLSYVNFLLFKMCLFTFNLRQENILKLCFIGLSYVQLHLKELA